MGAAIVLGLVFVFLVIILVGLLRGLDREDMRRHPRGLLSLSGVRGVVGGGFLVGLAYGLLVGGRSGAETWNWLSRGVVDGLVVACAGAFYIGFQQRKRTRGGPGAPSGGSVAGDPEDSEVVPLDSDRATTSTEPGPAGG